MRTGPLPCLLYIAILGIVSFFLGRILPKKWFRADAFPYRDYPFEQRGNLYRKIGIHRWQSHMPDMSRVFPKLMPPKRLTGRVNAREAELMVQETCVAEFTHILLSALGLACLPLWPGWGGALVYIAYVLLGNLPFILIQRFNRPKLIMMWEKCLRAEADK